jgi:hypothetical protein
VKRVVSINLGSAKNDYEFQTAFLDHQIHIQRIGTDGNVLKAAALLQKWDNQADAIGIGNVKFAYFSDEDIQKVKRLALHARKNMRPSGDGCPASRPGRR